MSGRIFEQKKSEMSYLFYRRFVCFWSVGMISRASCCRLHTCHRWWFYESSFVKSKSDVNMNQMEQRATVSVGIKIPRFLRKVKDKAQIQRYCLVKKLCFRKHFDTAVCYMKKWLEEEEAVTKSTILILNGLLHSLYKAERMEDVVTLKQIMDARNITGDQATYVVLIDAFGKIKKSLIVSELLKEIMSLGWVPHDRSYIVAAKLALERNAFSETFSYFRQIKGVFKDGLDDFCAQFIVGAAQTEQSIVLNIFNDFKINRVRIGKKTLEATRMYFESLSDVKWKTNLSKISSSGVCENCQRQLEELKFGKKEENLESYFKHLINLQLKGECTSMAGHMTEADLKTRDEYKVLKLIKYLKSNGPFHVIVDGLNVAMHPTHGLELNHLYSLVEYFANQEKKVLVVAANHLISPRKSKTASVMEHEQAMMHLRRVSNVYLVKQNQSGIDDLFLIFAALNSFRQHNDVKLVSNDKFMDHKFKMMPQMESDFNYWLHAHQIMIKAYDHEEPLIQIRPEYAFTVQNTHDSWHFPLDDRLWLCAERR